jgi:hypothetical protein
MGQEFLVQRRRARFGLGRCGFNHPADLLPEFVPSGAAFRGIGKQVRRRILLGECAENVVELVVGEAVTLGGHEQDIASGGAEEIEQLAIAWLRWDVDVDQGHTEGQRGSLVEIRLDKFGPLLGNRARDFGISVAGKVGENQFGMRFSGPADFEEIDAARASGSGTGARQFGADQGINDARFSHVGTAEEGDFRNRRDGKVGNVGSRRKKPGEDSHAQVCNGMREVGKRRESGAPTGEKRILQVGRGLVARPDDVDSHWLGRLLANARVAAW